jgi:hypothetical protein
MFEFFDHLQYCKNKDLILNIFSQYRIIPEITNLSNAIMKLNIFINELNIHEFLDPPCIRLKHYFIFILNILNKNNHVSALVDDILKI